VKSEWLDEQGFEKFFADPPAALVVLKGLRKLAERKVLLGRAPVQATGAYERATGTEAGMEYVRIEANDDESQVDEPQEDRAKNHDACGEKRTQFKDLCDVATRP
jgi:hypothetical protein